MVRNIGSLLVILMFFTSVTFAQREFIRWNTFDINKVRTKFSNANQLCNGNFQNPVFSMPPAFEYPAGSGIHYGTCVAFIIGGYQQDGGGENPNNWPCVDAAMSEGPADYWDPDHYDPYQSFVGGDCAAMSDDPESWPAGGFPDFLPNYFYRSTADYQNDVRTESPGLEKIPILKDETGWPGAGPTGNRLADQESFAVSYSIDHLAEIPPERWLTLQTITRGLAWNGKYYEDFIVWMFVGRNLGATPVTEAYFAVWSDYSFISTFNPPYPWPDDGDICYYDRKRQLAYGWDIDGMETSPIGGVLHASEIAWAGTLVLKTPRNDEGHELGLTRYDAVSNYNAQTTNIGNGARQREFYLYNLANLNDPRDSDGDGICDNFDGKDYFECDTEPVQILSSGPFTLDPGEMDTMIIATVFGTSKLDLFRNADQAIQLYKDKWHVISPPPCPRVNAIAGDQKVELIWDRQAETDSLFEGYRIYKSLDNGVTWGQPIRDTYGDIIAYKPLEIFDLADGITGINPLEPYFSLGQDVGLDQIRKVVDGDTVNYYIDPTVKNGYQYVYAVCAYTKGGPVKPPVENAMAMDASIPDDNVVLVIPHTPIAETTMERIRVVPNPYIISAQWEKRIGERRLDFTGLPGICTIRIYNSAAELVITIYHHNGQSYESWDLLSNQGQEIAPGLYFYRADSALGHHIGKFVVIY